MENHPVGAELFHVDGQTDNAKLTVALCYFAKASKNDKFEKLRFASIKKNTVKRGSDVIKKNWVVCVVMEYCPEDSVLLWSTVLRILCCYGVLS